MTNKTNTFEERLKRKFLKKFTRVSKILCTSYQTKNGWKSKPYLEVKEEANEVWLWIESALSSQKKQILGEVKKMHKRHVTDTLGVPNIENTEYDKTVNLIQMEVNGYNKAVDKVIKLLEEKE